MIATSSPAYQPIANILLGKLPEGDNPGTIILDLPTGYALRQLENLTPAQRKRAIVITPALHPAYHDVLASYHVRLVTPANDQSGLQLAKMLLHDNEFIPGFHSRTGITYMEARVLRLAILGHSTQAIGRALSINVKTVNAHISNLLGRLGHHSRAQLIAHLLTSDGDEAIA